MLVDRPDDGHVLLDGPFRALARLAGRRVGGTVVQRSSASEPCSGRTARWIVLTLVGQGDEPRPNPPSSQVGLRIEIGIQSWWRSSAHTQPHGTGRHPDGLSRVEERSTDQRRRQQFLSPRHRGPRDHASDGDQEGGVDRRDHGEIPGPCHRSEEVDSTRNRRPHQVPRPCVEPERATSGAERARWCHESGQQWSVHWCPQAFAGNIDADRRGSGRRCGHDLERRYPLNRSGRSQ